uniref:VWFA domain-containing protein n=1 Tax=Meloidogyne hapla TaxID=6305 RepID=A0A1I8BDN2_MELHA
MLSVNIGSLQLLWCFVFLLFLFPCNIFGKQEQSVVKKAEQLSRALQSIFEDGTKYEEISKAYADLTDVDVFSPQEELKLLKEEMEQYLKERAAIAWNAKISLEQRPLNPDEGNENETRLEDLNDPNKHSFVRYLNVKKMTDGSTLYRNTHFGGSYEINGSRQVHLRPNPSFYGLPTSSESSAVHVPTPIYNRDPELLQRIRWSDIDQQYRRNREQLKDLNFQKFCSDSGFMRFFPSAPWLWEDRQSELDLFDCRNTEWYVEAATIPRNLIILLDTSGSMLGQRFEIARQTIESILSTLSESDFFNIIQFSKTTTLMEQCGDRELVQASLRNKKVLLSRLNNISSEGKADYENALHKAFVALMNLPEEGVRWMTREEAAKEAAIHRSEGTQPDPDINYIQMEEKCKIHKFMGNQQQMGCQDVIILITDGAPGFFKEIFELYNKDKRIRFFSFIVGEEAKDFEQVRWMACSNRGFMAHIVSMADVQEKVQQYVRVLSKTVARQKAAFSENTPAWSGATRERMSEQLAISVSFPVILPNGQFMGVSSVSVPLLELSQLAHPIRVGGRSHFILLDSNGYLLFHPQLRPLEASSGELKAGFNSVEFADAEIQKPFSANRVSIDCSTGAVEPRKLETLFAFDELRHIYPQHNHYHVVCISGTPYTLVLALPKDDVQRLRRTVPLDLSSFQMNWLKGNDWRLQKEWKYCLLNDSDWAISAEDALTEYIKQMRESGKMPELCKPRQKLVERALLDLQASNGFSQLWTREWERNRKPALYRHFLLDLNPNAAESDFFRRATRQPEGRIIFDLNRKTRLRHNKNGRKTAYGHAEKDAILTLAYKAINIDGALAGVVGIEFLYDSLLSQMRHIGCLSDKKEEDNSRCYLLDENGFVIFSGSKNTKYSDFVEINILIPEKFKMMTNNLNNNFNNQKRRQKAGNSSLFGQRGIWAQQRILQQQKLEIEQNLELGRFFGQLNRVTEWTMELLIRRGFYKRDHFTDAQAICDPPNDDQQPQSINPTVSPTTTTTIITSAAASNSFKILPTLISFFTSLIQFIHHFVSIIAILLIPDELAASFIPINTFSSLLKVTDGRFQCRMHSSYYLGQTNVSADGANGALLESDSYERPCSQNAAQCAVRVFASWVPHTNLLLVIIRQDSHSQCFSHDSSSHCPLSQSPVIPFGFSQNLPPTSLDSSEQQQSAIINDNKNIECIVSQPQERNKPIQCLRDDFLEDDADEETCSGTNKIRKNWFITLFSSILVIFVFLIFR